MNALSISVVEIIKVRDIVGKVFKAVREAVRRVFGGDDIEVEEANIENVNARGPPVLGITVSEVIHSRESLG